MKSYFGSYIQPGSAASESTVLVFDKNLSIGFRDPEGVNRTVNWNLREIESQFIPSLQQTRIRHSRFPGQELLIDGKDADDFIHSLDRERQKPWHQRSSGKEWIRNTMLLLGILAVLFIIYLLIVPWLSSRLASKVSVKTERQLGDAVYDAMKLQDREDTAASYVLNEFFAEMDIATPYEIRISVVKDEVMNAFALPGGRIVVYSALLKQIRSYPVLAALLSHEFVHVNNKHSTRSIFRRMGSRVFIGLLFGKFGNVTAVLVEQADNLKSLNYSRQLEKEADMKGLNILTNRQIDPRGFISLFRKLEESAPARGLPEILASHPNIESRIRYIEEATANAEVRNNERLNMIFEKLKY
jgi:Zn-dependent protease with chaperone function